MNSACLAASPYQARRQQMQVAVVVESIEPRRVTAMPWMVGRAQLAAAGIHLQFFSDDTLPDAFEQRFDAMMLHVWLDWLNPQHFHPRRTMRLLERYATYRAAFPEVVQIILNHTDMARRPYATPYWRPGDPVLYRTPAYDRSELYPFPASSIWPFEMVWGSACFASSAAPRYRAGFIGSASGPKGYRERVAAATARVGIGLCAAQRPLSIEEHRRAMADSQIVVCPRGWGEQSQRHWDAWLSGKPVLTDRDCDAVEMIPGLRLRAGEHYLVYDEPEEIPAIVEEWTRPARREELLAIAEAGKQAAASYDAVGNILAFFRQALPTAD